MTLDAALRYVCRRNAARGALDVCAKQLMLTLSLDFCYAATLEEVAGVLQHVYVVANDDDALLGCSRGRHWLGVPLELSAPATSEQTTAVDCHHGGATRQPLASRGCGTGEPAIEALGCILSAREDSSPHAAAQPLRRTQTPQPNIAKALSPLQSASGQRWESFDQGAKAFA
ncbi:hypothetical protein SVAN01_07779 [Stagonosporopsis vannaccii]|nr:hypothetical protein SVAN01_07779 [Stagonosporopsis vannaccii]